MAIKGSCLCQKVVYEIDSVDMPVIHCHCQTCRKAHAAIFTSTAGVKREHFRWLKGEELLSSYEFSAGKFRHFCKHCGTHLIAQRPSQPHVIVRVATLDDSPESVPEAHIWVSHDLPWLEYENICQYPEWQ